VLPVSTPVILAELKSARKILTKWIKKIEAEGIPGVDGAPAPQETIDDYLRELEGELLMISGKTSVLSNVLNGEQP
jgi:hypothetical protein